jgi:toxin ParE1/3/4
VKDLPLSELATRDLEDIGDWIAGDRPRAAQRMVQKLLKQCERIVESPLAFPACEHIRAGYRRAFVKPYSIFYRMTARGPRIERVLHGARDHSALLDEN